MQYEAIVVGGGIGGLTAAAVLAKRGLSVCLLERQSYVGGCAATVEHAGMNFDPTYGLFSGWQSGGVYDRLFAELETTSPPTQALTHPYNVRLADGSDIARTTSVEEFEATLNAAFPECADAAVAFYHGLVNASGQPGPVANFLRECSPRFRSFIDVQLQTLAQHSIDECGYALAAAALDRTFWEIEGGVQSLIDLLVQSFKQNGGKLRLDSPVLRLAYEAEDVPIGVDLLNGERVNASRAIVSNLTIWDTYGKLIGAARTPREVSRKLKEMHAWGAYQIFLTINESIAAALPNRLLIASDAQEEDANERAPEQTVLSISPHLVGKNAHTRTAVITAKTRAEDWFSFHEDYSSHETRDQAMLENIWMRVHSAVPEIGDAADVIETATPQTYYENTRRRFGMIGRPVNESGAEAINIEPYSNVWLVGDTVSTGVGIDAVVESAWRVGRKITS